MRDGRECEEKEYFTETKVSPRPPALACRVDSGGLGAPDEMTES